MLRQENDVQIELAVSDIEMIQIIDSAKSDIHAFRSAVRARVDSFKKFFTLFTNLPDCRFKLIDFLFLIENDCLVEFKRLLNENQEMTKNYAINEHCDAFMEVCLQLGKIDDSCIYYMKAKITDNDYLVKLLEDLKLHLLTLKINSVCFREHFVEAADIRFQADRIKSQDIKLKLAMVCYPVFVQNVSNFKKFIERNSPCMGRPNIDGPLSNLIYAMKIYEFDILTQVVLQTSCITELMQHLQEAILGYPNRLVEADKLYRSEPEKKERTRVLYGNHQAGYLRRYNYIRHLLKVRELAIFIGRVHNEEELICGGKIVPELPGECLIEIVVAARDASVRYDHAKSVAFKFFGTKPTVISAAAAAAPEASDTVPVLTPKK